MSDEMQPNEYVSTQAGKDVPQPPAPTGQSGGEDIKYEYTSVHALRGREATTKAKLLSDGWEFVSQSQGTLRTELSFRRVKPKTMGDHLVDAAALFRQLNPKAQLAVAGSGALILIAGVTGIAVASQTGGSDSGPSAESAGAEVQPSPEAVEAASEEPAEAAVEEAEPVAVEAEQLTQSGAARHLAKAWEDRFVYGGTVHYFADLRAASQNEDGTYFLKIGATVKNEYGTEMEAMIEGTVGGTDDNPVILDSILFLPTGDWISYNG